MRIQKSLDKRSRPLHLKARETESIPLAKLTPMVLGIDHRDLPNRVKTFFTSVGNSADWPEPLLRPSPATGHAAEILDVYNPDLGYDAEKFPALPEFPW